MRRSERRNTVDAGRARPSDGPTAQQLSSGSFVYSNIVLAEYVSFAYNLKPYQLPKIPNELLAQYDISAKAAGPVSEEQAREMFQTLLEDRFHLKLQRESKEMPVYELALAKSGPKFSAAATDGPRGARMLAGGLAWHAITMDYLASWISSMPSIGRPVLNRTGLDGEYDLTLHFENPPAGGETIASQKAGLLTALDAAIFGSLQDLGLKLETAKASIAVYSVEHVEPPDAN